MASKVEYEVPAQYEDLTPAPQVDQKTLNRMALRSCFLQSSFNYETMQSGGWLFAMIPGLEKVHTNKNDLAASMYHNLDFINTHPFLVTFVMGIVLSLEQNKMDTQTIRAVRISAASPLGGIGDALFWLTLVPITAGITSNMAINGNIAAPIIFLLVFNVCQFALRFGLMNWAYKVGTGAIDALTANMQAFTRAASILGVFVVGALTVTMGATQINLEIPNGTTQSYVAHHVTIPTDDVPDFEEKIYQFDDAGNIKVDDTGAQVTLKDAEGTAAGVNDLGNGYSEVTYMEIVETPVNYSVAETLDSVLPKLVPLALVMLLFYLFTKHNFTPIKGIVLLLILGILGSGCGIWPSIW